MRLPNLSYMMHCGQTRYIQAQYESAEYRNPDLAVSMFLSPRQRLVSYIRGKLLISRLRINPFYFYVLARTRYYDEVFFDGICGSVTNIINIGCGSDTRAYRYAHILKQKGISVLECDQEDAIYSKQKIALKNWPTDHIKYVPLDLNMSSWPDFARLLDEISNEPVLVMMEGVSPYIISESFEAFLKLLASKLHADSLIAYDFKIAGISDNLGRTDRVRQPFRLPMAQEEIALFHNKLGFHIQYLELSSSLSERLLPGLPHLFKEDCLLRIKPYKQTIKNSR